MAYRGGKVSINSQIFATVIVPTTAPSRSRSSFPRAGSTARPSARPRSWAARSSMSSPQRYVSRCKLCNTTQQVGRWGEHLHGSGQQDQRHSQAPAKVGERRVGWVSARHLGSSYMEGAGVGAPAREAGRMMLSDMLYSPCLPFGTPSEGLVPSTHSSALHDCVPFPPCLSSRAFVPHISPCPPQLTLS